MTATAAAAHIREITSEEFWADDIKAAHPASDFSKLRASRVCLRQALAAEVDDLTPEQIDQVVAALLTRFPALQRYVRCMETVMDNAEHRA